MSAAFNPQTGRGVATNANDTVTTTASGTPQFFQVAERDSEVHVPSARIDHPQHDHTGYVRGLERAVDALLEKAPTFDSDWQAPGMAAVPLRLLSDLRKARDAGR